MEISRKSDIKYIVACVRYGDKVRMEQEDQ
jgi:hypothetical protein